AFMSSGDVTGRTVVSVMCPSNYAMRSWSALDAAAFLDPAPRVLYDVAATVDAGGDCGAITRDDLLPMPFHPFRRQHLVIIGQEDHQRHIYHYHENADTPRRKNT